LRPYVPGKVTGVQQPYRKDTSLPIEKPTRPAAVAEPGPALEPEEPSSMSQGFMVWPPNQMSLFGVLPVSVHD
jgi:hypothetical protein